MSKKIAEFRMIPSPPVDEVFEWMVAPRTMKHEPTSKQARINMIGLAHEINAEEVKASSEWYAAQKTPGGGSGSRVKREAGRDIFLHGIPAQGLLACQTCHGERAEGKASAPRLAGQNSGYLLNELEKFKTGDQKHAPEMTMVAQKGDSEQFHALASYLQSQK